jgi:hypothetical protein
MHTKQTTKHANKKPAFNKPVSRPIPYIAIGQIWKESDPKLSRFVQVAGVFPSINQVALQTVELIDGVWRVKRKDFQSRSDMKRFNNANRGFMLVQDTEEIPF